MRFVERCFAFVSLVMFAAAITTLGWWQFFDGPAIPISVEWSKTDRLVYHQGDIMHIQRKMCVAALPYVVHRAFIDHIVYSLADYATQVLDTGCAVRSINIEIPDALPPGRYVYRVWADFRLNPIRTVRFNYPDLPEITVLARDS